MWNLLELDMKFALQIYLAFSNIVSIRIGHLSNDIEDFEYRIDISDCTNYVGTKKEELFKINLDLEIES